jgi:hypothetical protein
MVRPYHHAVIRVQIYSAEFHLGLRQVKGAHPALTLPPRLSARGSGWLYDYQCSRTQCPACRGRCKCQTYRSSSNNDDLSFQTRSPFSSHSLPDTATCPVGIAAKSVGSNTGRSSRSASDLAQHRGSCE